MKQTSETAPRNCESIREILQLHLPRQGLVLEIASGTGEHAVFMARSFPFVAWQPTDIDADALASIAAWSDEVQLPNLLRPIALDVKRNPWPIAKADAIVCIDFAHAVPWEAVIALYERAAFVLPPGGLLHLFGPFRFHGKFADPTLAELDAAHQQADARHGVRDVRELVRLATRNGFGMPQALAISGHAHALTFKRDSMPPPTGRFQI